MRGLNRESMNKMSAVDIRVILYGVGLGLIVGATQLGDSAERATALGLAAAIELSVGLWLGMKVWLVVSQLFRKWIASLRERVMKLESQTGTRFPDTPVPVRLTIWCIVLIPFGTTLFAFGSTVAIMDMGLSIHSTVSYLPNLIVGATLALIGIAMPCLDLLLIERDVRRLENKLDTTAKPAIRSLASTNDLNRAYGWTNSVLGKLVGYKAAA